MKIIGIDWGDPLGLAWIEMDGTFDDCKTLAKMTSKKATKKSPARELWWTWGEYLGRLATNLTMLVEEGDVVALEDPGGHLAKDGWLSHARIRGVAELIAAQAGASFVLVPTNRAKVVAVGNGRAEKKEMIDAACMRWGKFSNGPLDLTEHEADALWVAETARLGRE